MGSLEEEILIQMVHDFIESDSSSPNFSASSKNGFQVSENQAATVINTLQEILLDMSEAEKKVTESVLRHVGRRRTAERNSSNLRKWLVMKMNMDGLTPSLRHTSWVTSFGFPAGDYEYIEVTFRHESGERTRVIVDVDFRSQFELARPTPLYKRLTDTLPAVFVGSEDKLTETISLLCAATKKSLEERGLHVPPWRTAAYMRCKWLSTPDSDAGGRRLGFGKWLPPAVGPGRGDGDFRGGSGRSGQLESSLGINCC